MLKRLAYIVLLLIFAASLSSAKAGMARHEPVKGDYMRYDLASDTTKKQKTEEDSKKIKEISKAKRQVKPEKISDKDADKAKPKPKRERRPEGLDRPPEIPRRNGN
ncbi:hypothetical protein [Mucilaginibacter sp. dw_454]|uniref:hypothetical protein n=1 Tax=Mucilaginibacter sp. dw_454 TaxID=2720079 RepID=UPI001BD31645|nr:hypothetical protein [Mucilaginibacter sp. dw_454]